MVTNDAFIGDAGATAYWTLEQLRTQLWALPEEGTVELMCHAGYAPIAVKSGYGEQRGYADQGGYDQGYGQGYGPSGYGQEPGYPQNPGYPTS